MMNRHGRSRTPEAFRTVDAPPGQRRSRITPARLRWQEALFSLLETPLIEICRREVPAKDALNAEFQSRAIGNLERPCAHRFGWILVFATVSNPHNRNVRPKAEERAAPDRVPGDSGATDPLLSYKDRGGPAWH